MDIQIKIIGIIQILLALIHLIFPRYFQWKKELASLSLINRQMMMVHTFFIALIVFLMGLLSVFYSNALLQTPLGKIISLGLSIFWFMRLLIQFFGYSNQLWKGKTFETIIHYLFIIFWSYFTLIYLLTFINNP